MQLVVFHGSDKIIKMPQHNGGRKFSDFGLGFYITTNVEMAKSWATRKKEKPAFINKYLLNAEGMKSLTFDLDLTWILFIAYNRSLILNDELQSLLQEKYKNINEYDILIGPTADDKMFDTLNMFFSNTITLDHCLQSLNSMDLDIQYNIRSHFGINSLSFITAMELDDMDKEYYSNEIKAKKDIMNRKMEFIRRKYRKIGKYFDEIGVEDIHG